MKKLQPVMAGFSASELREQINKTKKKPNKGKLSRKGFSYSEKQINEGLILCMSK